MFTDQKIVERDELISIGDAATYLAAAGKPVTRQTIYNWVKRGIRVDGERTHLKTKDVNGKTFTTLRWLEAFIQCAAAHPHRTGRKYLADW